MTIELRIKPQGPVLEQFYLDRTRNSFIMGPLGSGKTIQICIKILKLMCEQDPNKEGIRPSRWVAIRNTYPDLLSTTAKDWLEIAGDLGRFSQGSKEPPNQKLKFQLEDGTIVQSELIFLAMDRDDHIKKLRGMQCTGFWLSEAKELPKAVLDMADLRHGRYPSMATGGVLPTWHGMQGDTNAPDDDHWYYEIAEGPEQDGWAFFRQPGGVIKNEDKQWEVNPNAENLKNLPQDYYFRGMQNKSHDWIKVNLGNEYGSLFDGKAVYDEFNQQLHVAEFDADPDLPLLLSWDFGLTPACLISQMTPNGQLRVLHEFLADRSGIQQFGINVIRPFLWSNYKGFEIVGSVGDPAGMTGADTDERTCIGVLSTEYNKEDPMMGGVGIPTIPASSNALEKRLGAVKGFLNRLIDGHPAIVIHKRCKLLIKGFLGGYHFEKVQVTGKAARFKEMPSKNKYSHPHDALQYKCMLVLEGIPEYDEEDYEDQEMGRSAVGGY